MVENGVRTVPGVILAGGRSRRMGGGDKSLLELAGRPILAWVIERLRPQAAGLALNANGDPARFAGFGLPIIADSVPDFAGPLAGILAALDWAAQAQPQSPHVLTVASDTPFLPTDLAARLCAAASREAAAVLASSGGRLHPVIGLWSVAQRDDLRQALAVDGLRKVEDWTCRIATARVEFSTAPIDPFFNVNSPDDLAAAAGLIERARA